MRITRPFVSALAVISVGVLFIAAQPAKADFIWTFNQTGTNTVVVTGSGSFNTVALGEPTPDGPFVVENATFSNMTFLAGSLNGTYKAWRSGTSQVLSGSSSFVFSADFAATALTVGDFVEMFLEDGDTGSGFALNANYLSGAPVSNTTTLANVSLTDFGYSTLGTLANPVHEGTWTLQNPNTGAPAGTISIYSIYSVPEPSQMMLLAGAGLTVGAWRMRKLRRKPVASTATAC